MYKAVGVLLFPSSHWTGHWKKNGENKKDDYYDGIRRAASQLFFYRYNIVENMVKMITRIWLDVASIEEKNDIMRS
jgi:hypothetical protein